jgi:cytochrome P450
MSDNDRTDLDWEDVRYFVALARYGTLSENHRMRMASASQHDLPDLTSQDYLRDPAAGLAKLRAAGPIVEVRFPMFGKTWITTTHEFAERVLKDSETFRVRKNSLRWLVPVLRWLVPGWIRALAVSMLSMDAPDHKRLRGIVDEAFRRRAILDMEPRILAIADELATDLFAEGSPADLVERYALRLPLLTICELLGLPRDDRPMFITWAVSVTNLAGMRSFLGMMAGVEPMRHYLEARLQVARETGGEGLIAELVRVEKEGGRISGQEMVAMIFLLLGAGSETTTHLISGSVYEILRAPKLRDWLEENYATGSRKTGLGPTWQSRSSCASSRPCSSPSLASSKRISTSVEPICGRATGSCLCWLPPTWTPRQIRILKNWILRGNPIARCRSARVSISAWATSSHVWSASARWKRSSSAGRSSSWRCHPAPFAGIDEGLASGPSKNFP